MCAAGLQTQGTYTGLGVAAGVGLLLLSLLLADPLCNGSQHAELAVRLP